MSRDTPEDLTLGYEARHGRGLRVDKPIVDLKKYIRDIPDFPESGILFRDITPLLRNPQAFNYAIDRLVDRYSQHSFDTVVAVESRGFLFGAPLASRMGKSLVPVRKPGKLPWQTIGVDYQLEYGSDRLEMHTDSIDRDDRILLVDDLVATGGTAVAAVSLIRQGGGHVVGASFVIDLPDIGGADRLRAMDLTVRSLMEFEGD